ncbi:hypothetical protein PV760_08145 [Paenarthrobacter sp. CC6]|uniref:hypothetical protein n=1 Tax=Paenarthrobacter TaxID=1742992 RepID=UPI0009D459F7|nr:hypothetical protein [Paenarthrobacter nicotinovorans]MDI2020585.1 hypothetical protein [Paenarthrobacter nicotinovorans]SKB76917.1 hypothetical protein SAMN05660916_02558 [Arthrobacter sp. 31Cvi3.1E]
MKKPKLAVVVMPIGSVLVVLVVGYLALQTEGMLSGYLFDLSGTPTTSIAKRFPWELQVATVLVCFAASVAYRRLAVDRRLKMLVFGTLVLASVLSLLFYETVHTTRTSLLAMAFADGGISPLILGFIAVIAADTIHSKRGLEPAAYQRG